MAAEALAVSLFEISLRIAGGHDTHWFAMVERFSLWADVTIATYNVYVKRERERERARGREECEEQGDVGTRVV